MSEIAHEAWQATRRLSRQQWELLEALRDEHRSTTMKLKKMSVAWYDPADWPRWCAMCDDFQPDYQHWLGRAEAAFREMQADGVPVVKTLIKPDEFLAWTTERSAGLNSGARSAFAGYKAMKGDMH